MPCEPLAVPRRRSGRRRRRAQIPARLGHQRYRQGARRSGDPYRPAQRRKGRSCSTSLWCRTVTAFSSMWRRTRPRSLVQRLGFYRLQGAVEIAEEPSLAVAAAWGGPPRLPDGAIAYADPRLPELGLSPSASPKQRMRPISAASPRAKRIIMRPAHQARRARRRPRLRVRRRLSA